MFMSAPVWLRTVRGDGAARASPTPESKLEGQIRILCDAFQPTYDLCAVAGHHGVARARFGAAATRRRGPNHSDRTCCKACRLLFCKRDAALAGFVRTMRRSTRAFAAGVVDDRNAAR